MKNLKYLFISFFIVFAFASCEDEDKLIYDAELAEAPAIQSPTTNSTIELSLDNEDGEVVFSWSAADLRVSVAVTYTVEFSVDDSFSEVAELAETSDTTAVSVSVSDINTALLSLDYTIGESAVVYCRVVTYINDNVEDVISETASYTVIPYDAVVAYPEIYVPGAYQGWSPGATNGILYSYNFDAVYEGIIYIDSDDAATSFKVTPEADWDVAWGGTLSEDGSGGYTGSLDASGGDYSVVPGCYAFTVNTDELTIELTATDYWGIIGSSVAPYDWSEDIDMFYNGSTQQWEVTTDLVAGELKFRANDAWTLNYGIDDDGNLSSGGSNITIESDGTYTVSLDMNNMTYSVTEN